MSVKLIPPIPGAPVTAHFGWRPAFTENGVWVPAMLHNGTDYGAPAGTPIRAMAAGRVSFAGWDYEGGGNAVKIGAAQASTMYLHMIRPTHLRLGDHVAAGDVVGYVGSTGMSTGDHLHAMLQLGGQWINPLPYIAATPKPHPKPKPPPPPRKEPDMIGVMITDGEGRYGAKGARYFAISTLTAFVQLDKIDADAISRHMDKSFANITYPTWERLKKVAEATGIAS